MMMIYLLTAIGLSPGGSSTVHIYTQIIHRTIQNKLYIEQHNNLKSVDDRQMDRQMDTTKLIDDELIYNTC
jgi:hypothetical protein